MQSDLSLPMGTMVTVTKAGGYLGTVRADPITLFAKSKINVIYWVSSGKQNHKQINNNNKNLHFFFKWEER